MWHNEILKIFWKIAKEEADNDFHLQEDLVQEMLLHYWQMKKKNPNHKKSYYIQGCKNRARNYRKKFLDKPEKPGAKAILYVGSDVDLDNMLYGSSPYYGWARGQDKDFINSNLGWD